MSKDSRKILVAPLNWGLGHATRCIPIIKALLNEGFEPVIASDGAALVLLKKEFPELHSFELPSYNITYPKNGSMFRYKLLTDTPHLLRTIKKEKAVVQQIVKKFGIAGIISDNRFGVRHPLIPSVFITHQLTVLSGSTTWASTMIHQSIISKFDECWVPDFEGETNLSGRLSHLEHLKFPVKYIGPLSRFQKTNVPTSYDILVLLSGPEPQRSLLSKKLLQELDSYPGRVCFVEGIIEDHPKTMHKGTITIHNFLIGKALERVINASKIIVSRSGYTTVMDLAKLGKKAFFIPTPGQYEQVYLAQKLKEDLVAPYCAQNEFTVKHLELTTNYHGFAGFNCTETNLNGLFHLFQGEGKLTSHT